MENTPNQQRKRWRFSYKWVLWLLVILAFLLSAWLRTHLFSKQEKLVSLIEAREPQEHVHAIAIGADGTRYVATHFGLITGKTERDWARLQSNQSDIWSIVSMSDGSLVIAGDQLGIARLQGTQQEQLRQGRVHALAQDPQRPERLLAYELNQGLLESVDRGKTWQKRSAAPIGDVLALAVSPVNSNTLVAGGIGGMVARSSNGGESWDRLLPLSESISALTWTPSGQLFAASGGRVFLSQDQGTTWQLFAIHADDRTVVALTAAQDQLFAVASDGHLIIYPLK
jgi:WD40 repeat protein